MRRASEPWDWPPPRRAFVHAYEGVIRNGRVTYGSPRRSRLVAVSRISALFIASIAFTLAAEFFLWAAWVALTTR